MFSIPPLNHVVIDNLHLFLRVNDVLIDQLIMELLRLDAIDKARRVAGLDRTKHKHVAAFEEFVGSLGISVFWGAKGAPPPYIAFRNSFCMASCSYKYIIILVY